MKLLTSFDPTSATSGQFDPLIANPCGKIYLFNESPVGLSLTFQDGSTAALPAYYFRSFVIRKPGMVKWQQAYSLAIGGSPANNVLGEAYERTEVSDVAWTEGPLNRQTSIGNTLPVSTTTNLVKNDGNAAGTTFVESTVSGDSSSAVQLNNDGTLILGNANRGGLLKLVSGVSNIKIGADTANTNLLYIDAPDGSRVFQINSGGVDLVTGTGGKDLTARILHATSTVQLSSGSISAIAKQSANLNAGTSTYTHNLGWTPDYTVITATGGGSATVGWSTPTNTTIVFTVGATLHYDFLFIKF